MSQQGKTEAAIQRYIKNIQIAHTTVKLAHHTSLILTTFSSKRYFILTYWFIFIPFFIKISMKVTKTLYVLIMSRTRFQSESTLYIYLNVKEPLTRNRRDI